jgi:hypothetical protein
VTAARASSIWPADAGTREESARASRISNDNFEINKITAALERYRDNIERHANERLKTKPDPTENHAGPRRLRLGRRLQRAPGAVLDGLRAVPLPAPIEPGPVYWLSALLPAPVT